MARVKRKRKRGSVLDQEEKKTTNTNQILAIVGIGLILVVVLAIFVGLSGDNPVVTAEVAAGEDRLIGDADAPLLIRDFSDFRCPHCKDAANILTPKIIEHYVDTGKVQLEFVPVAVLGEESAYSGQASLCAEEQGQFWPYHDKLFQRQGRDQFNVTNLSSFADELGLEEQAFRDCILSGKYASQMEENNRAMQQAGGSSTPTFMVGDQLVAGAIPFEEMEVMIKEQLGEE